MILAVREGGCKMPKRMGKLAVHLEADKKARSLMCNVGAYNAKKISHQMWLWCRKEEKRIKEMKI